MPVTSDELLPAHEVLRGARRVAELMFGRDRLIQILAHLRTLRDAQLAAACRLYVAEQAVVDASGGEVVELDRSREATAEVFKAEYYLTRTTNELREATEGALALQVPTYLLHVTYRTLDDGQVISVFTWRPPTPQELEQHQPARLAELAAQARAADKGEGP